MEIKTHNIKDAKIAEIVSDKIIITKAEDALDILGNAYFNGADSIILYEKTLSPSSLI